VQYETRSFAVDVLECPRCGGRRKLIAVITEPAAIVAILESLGLATRAPPPAPARRKDGGEQDEPTPSWSEPRQDELDWQGGEADPVVE